MAVEQAVNKAASTAKGIGSYAWTTFKTLAPLTTVFGIAGVMMGGGPAALAAKAGADIGLFDLAKLSWEGATEVGGAALEGLKSGIAAVSPHLNDVAAATPIAAPA